MNIENVEFEDLPVDGGYDEDLPVDEPSPYEEITDDMLVNICVESAANSIRGIDGGETTLALDYYFGRKPVLAYCKDPKAATVVSLDVRDSVEATVAELLPAFNKGDIARFEPSEETDEEQAKMESDICNYLFMEEYNGISILTVALKDCLLQRNAYARVFWDTRHEVGYESYDQVPEQSIAEILEPRVEGEEVDVTDHEEVEPPEEMIEQHEQMMQQHEQTMQGHQQMMQQYMQAEAMGMTGGQPPPEEPQAPEMPSFFNVSIRRKTIKSEPVIESIAPENALISSALQEVDLDQSQFTGMRAYPTRSELIAQGYDPDVIMDLPSYSGTKSEGTTRRVDAYSGTGSRQAEYVEVLICYVECDRDRDGVAEMRRVIISNNTLLDDQPWDSTDMVAGATCILPHQHEGVSLFDTMKDVQDIKTDLLRTILDGAALAAHQRLEATDDVNFDDLLSASRGGIVRSKRIGSVAQLPNPEIPPSVYSTLEIMDKLRRERGGSAVDGAQQSMQIGGESAHGIERVMTSIEQSNALLAAQFSETFVRGIYLRLHALIRKYHRGEISARIDGQWVSSEPSHWPERHRVAIQVGSSQGERQRMASALQGIQINQKELLAQGAPIVSQDKLYESSVDIARYLGVNNPEQYYVDPSSEEGQQAAQQAQEAQEAEQAKMEEEQAFQRDLQTKTVEAQTQVAQAEMAKAQVQGQNNQLRHQIDQLKQQLAQAEASADIQLQHEELNRDTAIKLLDLEQKANTQLDKEYQQNKRSA